MPFLAPDAENPNWRPAWPLHGDELAAWNRRIAAAQAEDEIWEIRNMELALERTVENALDVPAIDASGDRKTDHKDSSRKSKKSCWLCEKHRHKFE